jgi:hypothetical protein
MIEGHLGPVPIKVKAKGPHPGRDSGGHWLKGVSGFHPNKHPQEPPSNASLEDTIAADVDRKRLARVLLQKAYKGDPRSVEFVAQVLGKRIQPRSTSEYDADLLTEPELRLLLILLQKAKGVPIADKDLFQALRSCNAPAPAREPEEPEPEPLPQPEIPAPKPSPRPTPQAKPLIAGYDPDLLDRAQPSTGNSRRSLVGSMSNTGDYDTEGKAYDIRDLAKERPN